MNQPNTELGLQTPAYEPPTPWAERFIRWGLGLFCLWMMLDGGFGAAQSCAEEGGNGWIGTVLRLGVLGFALGTNLLVILTPKCPRRLALPLVFGGYWVAGGAFPLPMSGLDNPWFVVGLIELLLGVFSMALLVAGAPKPAALAERPWVSGWNTLGMLLVSGMAVPLLLVVSAANGLAWTVDSYSKGYLQVRPNGLIVEERRYVRGADEVWLIAMMHVADAAFYTEVLPTDADAPTIVLLEGVTDRNGKMEGDLGMDNFAKLLGLTPQNRSGFARRSHASPESGDKLADGEVIEMNNGIRLKRADVDISEFTPGTLQYLKAVGEVFRSPDLLTMFRRMTDTESPLADQDLQRSAFRDILDRRNAHLMGEIERSFADYDRVIVPWGALHMPEVEDWLKQSGFTQSGTIERVAVAFGKKKD